MSIVIDEKPFNENELNEDEVLSNFTEDPSVDEDKLEEEISENSMPEKFVGKSAEEVAQAYAELEKQYGQKANEVGELRKLADDFLKRELEQIPEKQSETTKSNIDLDELLENPSDVLNKVVDESPRVQKLERELLEARITEQRKGFEKEHPDWVDVISSPGFQEWVTSNSILQQTFIEADKNYDYARGSELLSMYKSIHGERIKEAKEKVETKRKKAMKAASTEKGGTGEAPKKVYLRADLIRLKQLDPERYAAMGAEIRQAYAEGRVK